MDNPNPSRVTLGDVSTSLAVLQQRIESLTASVQRIENSVTQTLREQGGELRTLQSEHAQRCVLSDNLRRAVDSHEQRLDDLEKLAPAMKVVIWLGAVLGVSILGLIWALITGVAQVVVIP